MNFSIESDSQLRVSAQNFLYPKVVLVSKQRSKDIDVIQSASPTQTEVIEEKICKTDIIEMQLGIEANKKQPSSTSKQTSSFNSEASLIRKPIVGQSKQNSLISESVISRLLNSLYPQISEEDYKDFDAIYIGAHTALIMANCPSPYHYLVLEGAVYSISEEGNALYTHREGSIIISPTPPQISFALGQRAPSLPISSSPSDLPNSPLTFASSPAPPPVTHTPRLFPFTLSTGEESVLCARFTDDTYVRSLKKYHQKQLEQRGQILSGVFGEQMKKYVGYFAVSTLKYGEIVAEGMFVVMWGEVEVEALVRACRGELVELGPNQRAKVVSGMARVLVLAPQVYQRLLDTCPELSQTLERYRGQVQTHHLHILQKNIRVVKKIKRRRHLFATLSLEPNRLQSNGQLASQVSNSNASHNHSFDPQNQHPHFSVPPGQHPNSSHSHSFLPNSIANAPTHQTAKIRRRKKKSRASLEWWGLAENYVSAQKPLDSNKDSVKDPIPKPNIPNKITLFKKKVFEQALEAIEHKENQESPFRVDYIPKIQKLRLKVCDLKPKVITNKEKIKKKLLSYAKSGEVFVDQLQLV